MIDQKTYRSTITYIDLAIGCCKIWLFWISDPKRSINIIQGRPEILELVHVLSKAVSCSLKIRQRTNEFMPQETKKQSKRNLTA